MLKITNFTVMKIFKMAERDVDSGKIFKVMTWKKFKIEFLNYFISFKLI